MELTKRFGPDQYASALESWGWISDMRGRTPAFTSVFGHIFLTDGSGYWWLDPIGATYEHVAPDRESLEAKLATEAGQDELLLGGLALAADRYGVRLGPDEIYELMPPPALGGSFDVERIQPADFVVSINIAGQIHEQIRDLPPGTRISGLRITDP
jgi:hypothetical protein